MDTTSSKRKGISWYGSAGGVTHGCHTEMIPFCVFFHPCCREEDVALTLRRLKDDRHR